MFTLSVWIAFKKRLISKFFLQDKNHFGRSIFTFSLLCPSAQRKMQAHSELYSLFGVKPIMPWPIERYILVQYCISYLQKYVKPTSCRPCHLVSHVHRHRQGQFLATNTQLHIRLAQREVWLPGKTVNHWGAVRKGAEDWNNMVLTPTTRHDVNLWEDSHLILVLHHSNCAGVRERSTPHFQQDCGICLWFSHDVSASFSSLSLLPSAVYCLLSLRSASQEGNTGLTDTRSSLFLSAPA